ncbi:hypothetical protein C8R46DRAFT_1116119 [Mycena filopes]|nr:hypothetical protein C8R46DRAFT_1116119 [Mycena filopes]
MASIPSPPRYLCWKPALTSANPTPVKHRLTGLGKFFPQPCTLCAAQGKKCEIQKKKLKGCVRCSQRKKSCSHRVPARGGIASGTSTVTHSGPDPDSIILSHPWKTAPLPAAGDADMGHSVGNELPANDQNVHSQAMNTLAETQTRDDQGTTDWAVFLNIEKEWLVEDLWSTPDIIGQGD